MKKQLEEKKAVVENLKGIKVYDIVHKIIYNVYHGCHYICILDWITLNTKKWLFLVAAKKEEVETIEKEAKDKHEKEWEGKSTHEILVNTMIIWSSLKPLKDHVISASL